MRISTNMMYLNATKNLSKSQQQYLKSQEQLVSQKRVNRPSDDPIAAARILDINKQLGLFDQFDRNINQAKMFIDQTETALEAVRDALMRIEEVAVDINGGIAGSGEYAAVASEVENLYDEILRAANTKLENRFIFSGYETSTEPFDASGNYNGGVDQPIEIEINQGAFIQVNFDGEEVFKDPLDIFQVVEDMRAAIEAGDQDAISTNIPLISDALDQVLNLTSQIGARSNRMEVALTNNQVMIESYTTMLSNIEDSDIVQASVDFAEAEQVYMSTMEVTSRILQQSFLDFLR